jgi:transposase
MILLANLLRAALSLKTYNGRKIRRTCHDITPSTDASNTIFADEQFVELYSNRGQPAASPAQLALVTVMQFAEGLSDRAAANAVRARIDWKYALGLEITDTGFDASVLSEFRTRLVEGQAELLLFDCSKLVAGCERTRPTF